MEPVKMLKRGAEAELYLSDWHGRRTVIKRRVVKSYRRKELDERLQAARIKNEARLMAYARRQGVSVPIIYDVNLSEKEIVMEFIDGPQVKTLINLPETNETNETDVPNVSKEELAEMMGRSIGRLHKGNLVHGDLTTSNMLYKSGRIYFIDFSLGERTSEVEKKGVDMHLLKEAFLSVHSRALSYFDIVASAYVSEYPEGKDVLDKVKEIGRRGRYR